jgi:Uma2 family endonuclease
MTAAIKIPATYADIEALPPNVVGEILFGSLVVHKASAPRHALALGALGALVGCANSKGAGAKVDLEFLNKPEVRLGEHILVPDVCGWRRGTLDFDDNKNWIDAPPFWVGEILAIETLESDIGPKLQIYADHGVEFIWLANSIDKSLSTYVLSGHNYVLTHKFANQETVSAPPFESLPFNLGLLWPFDQPST